jgi:hypothetical protein
MEHTVSPIFFAVGMFHHSADVEIAAADSVWVPALNDGIEQSGVTRMSRRGLLD